MEWNEPVAVAVNCISDDTNIGPKGVIVEFIVICKMVVLHLRMIIGFNAMKIINHFYF